MGPNGSGKTTLAHVLAGDPKYNVTKGAILLNNVDIKAFPIIAIDMHKCN